MSQYSEGNVIRLTDGERGVKNIQAYAVKLQFRTRISFWTWAIGGRKIRIFRGHSRGLLLCAIRRSTIEGPRPACSRLQNRLGHVAGGRGRYDT